MCDKKEINIQHNCDCSDSRNEANLKRMASKVPNFSDLIQRVTSSCLLHPLAGVSRPDNLSSSAAEEEDFGQRPPARIAELEMLMSEVFDGVWVMKRAYISLQEAHCPWDPDKMRSADVAVVAELRRLGLLRERFRRSVSGGGTLLLREAVEELNKEVKLKQMEIENLRDKLKTATSFDRLNFSAKSKRRVSCTTQGQAHKFHNLS